MDVVTAAGKLADGGTIWIKYGAERVLRDGRERVALPVDGRGVVTLSNGSRGEAASRLPEARARRTAFGVFTVEAVLVSGTVEF